jgi:hypothetical protein
MARTEQLTTSTLRFLILAIVGRCTGEQVIGVDASGVIAVMAAVQVTEWTIVQFV